MARIERLETVFVDTIPEKLQDGILYVSEECRVDLHNCACGCGEEVSTPLGRTAYQLSIEGGAASIWPSIGNHDFACASHYVIKQGTIVWTGRMSRIEIEAGRERDRRLKRPPVPVKVPFEAASPAPETAVRIGLIKRTFGAIKALWHRLVR